ncbi:MAG: ABC transporter ATP-binding protein/permease [Hyphomicrobiales bacterium]|nr:ABC transporter ATP-binding protein/permease [Hyphomicrobiales bacterium]
MIAQSSEFSRSFFAYAGRRAPAVIGLVLAAAVLEGVGILLLVPFLELLTGPPLSDATRAASWVLQSLGLATPRAQLVAGLGAFFVLLVLRGVVMRARDVRLASLSLGFVDHWRNQVFRALAGATWPALTALRHTEVEHTITNDVSRIAEGTDRLMRGSVALALVVIQLVVAFMLSPVLTSVVLAAMAVLTLPFTKLMRKAHLLGSRLTVAGREIHAVLGDFLTGLKLAKSHGSEAGYIERFDAKTENVRRQLIEYTADQAGFRLVFQLIAGAAACAIILAGVFVFNSSAAILTVSLVILMRLSGPFMTLLQAIQSFANMMPAFASVRELKTRLERNSDVVSLPDAGARSPAGPAKIVLQDVCFRYAGEDSNALDDVSLTVAPGETVAVTGPSGSGKTTLADIIVGLQQPADGTVEIDGELLTGQVLERWQREIAYVPQDPFLFDQSIQDNLLWARPDAMAEDLWKALQMASADGFVRGLKDGLDTRVGNRGHQLSGGERQRICLARALLRQPRLLLLDEATNAVDLDLERQLLETLRPLSAQMTIIMITHRLFHVSDHVRCVEFRNGRII